MVVDGRLPLAAIDGDKADPVPSATSAFDTIENRDTVTAGVGAAINVVQSVSPR